MQKIAGALFFLAGALILLGIITAEIFYPVSYSISQNMISNLAATPPPQSIIREPSASIFGTAMIAAGIMLLVGVYFLCKAYPKKHLVVFLVFMGIGTAGVGIFPAYHATIHPIVALVSFLGGGIAALISTVFVKPPFKYLAGLLGFITLSVLFLGLFSPQMIVPLLGRGGTERWVVYPMVLWLIGFGGYLMNSELIKTKKKF